jgi:hypothetical protein
MTEQEENKAIEALITVALINVANEQGEMIRDVYRQRRKQELNTWLKMGNKLLNNLKKDFTEHQIEMLDNMTDVYHDQSDSIRKQIKSSK